MGNWVVIVGWVTALALAAAAASSALRLRGNWRDPGAWAVPLPFACLAVIALTVLGVLAPLTGGVLAAVLAVGEGIFLYRGDDKPLYAFAGHLGGGFRHLAGDVRSASAAALPRRGNRQEPAGGRQVAHEVQPEAAPPAGGSVPRFRDVPPLRDDPALGPLPEPADVAAGLATAGVEVPAPWASLAAWVAGFEPEDDNQQLWFIAGAAAGFIALGEAFHAHADNIVSGVGLDPSYGSAVLDLGDAAAGASGHATHTNRRYNVIYGAVKEAVSSGLHLPHRARQWFGGPGGDAPQDGPGENAA